ncbi:MAG: hypothetical protein IMZ50_12785 [Candidatus Atribacteria bacterium]|nr:hypothetical protein [Candidatus Atribacteria bacterium]
MLEPGHSQVPFKVQKELLKVSYSSLFYKPLPHEVAIKTALTRSTQRIPTMAHGGSLWY